MILSTGTGTLTPQALECVAWISKQQAMSKKLLASAFLILNNSGIGWHGLSPWCTMETLMAGGVSVLPLPNFEV